MKAPKPIVGTVERTGGGFAPKSKDQPHAKLAPMHQATMPSTDTLREPRRDTTHQETRTDCYSDRDERVLDHRVR
jgi:hypothetical protein